MSVKDTPAISSDVISPPTYTRSTHSPILSTACEEGYHGNDMMNDISSPRHLIAELAMTDSSRLEVPPRLFTTNPTAMPAHTQRERGGSAK